MGFPHLQDKPFAALLHMTFLYKSSFHRLEFCMRYKNITNYNNIGEVEVFALSLFYFAVPKWNVFMLVHYVASCLLSIM